MTTLTPAEQSEAAAMLTALHGSGYATVDHHNELKAGGSRLSQLAQYHVEVVEATP